ncbi:MAG: methyltransferase domain-containing protein [Candidatus Abyssobacteria bacterium SURF_5]|uniref:Methyltransferase domain-containing protein n=1 Tax=Abyssobacteria bacterium (strain SURF_5) TaxID=2093360 RepID=A0A3A4NC87_ABYX5|nr:MAG: methyltransferase domain-containing protein [Candidatus Abyssubacteria bacterium SURF_5]
MSSFSGKTTSITKGYGANEWLLVKKPKGQEGHLAIPTKKEIINLYRKRGKRYDFTANLYYLLGFREYAYRKRAVEELGLTQGDTVVEIGCGTGLNFPFLQQKIGPNGKIIGVDLTDAMLAQARKRAEKNGWKNVELVQQDASTFSFPSGVDGIISTFALTLVPGFEQVIRNGCHGLKPGKKWVVLDFKLPSGRLSALVPLAIFITKPFAVTKELAERHPWEAIEKYCKNVRMTELYFGFAYISSGERGDDGC